MSFKASQSIVVEVAEFECHVPAQRDCNDVNHEHERHRIQQDARLSQERQRYTRTRRCNFKAAILYKFRLGSNPNVCNGGCS